MLSDAFHLRGKLWADKKDFDRALADYNEAIRIDGNPLSFNNRGYVRYLKKDFDRALADYDEALHRFPHNPAFLYNRSLAWRDKGELKKAIADLDEAAGIIPAGTDFLMTVLSTRAFVQEISGDFVQARAGYKAVLGSDPKNQVAIEGLNRLGE